MHTSIVLFFFLNDTAPTEIYPLPLHDALPISFVRECRLESFHALEPQLTSGHRLAPAPPLARCFWRSEEHTYELQSRLHLVCRLLLEKKKIDLVWISQTDNNSMEEQDSIKTTI